MARKAVESVSITSAGRRHSDDIGVRQRRYVVSMLVRTACFLLAVVTVGTWWMWVFLAGSVVLPYVAVVVANTQATTDPDPGPEPFDLQRRAIGPSTPTAPRA